MQSNLCVHTKYENMDKIYLYPIWEYFLFCKKKTCAKRKKRRIGKIGGNRVEMIEEVDVEMEKEKVPVKMHGTGTMWLLSARVPQALLQTLPSSPSPEASLRANQAWNPRHRTSCPQPRTSSSSLFSNSQL